MLRQKKLYNIRSKTNLYFTGDKVYLHTIVKKPGENPKLRDNWLGPFEVPVLEALSDVTFRIRDGNGKVQVVHHDRLKPCHEREETVGSESESELDSSDTESPVTHSWPYQLSPRRPDNPYTPGAQIGDDNRTLTTRGILVRKPARLDDFVLHCVKAV